MPAALFFFFFLPCWLPDRVLSSAIRELCLLEGGLLARVQGSCTWEKTAAHGLKVLAGNSRALLQEGARRRRISVVAGFMSGSGQGGGAICSGWVLDEK